MNIIPNPASQRTSTDNGILYINLNKNYDEKQYIVYTDGNQKLYLGKMNIDGSNWSTNLIYSVDNDIFFPIVSDIYQDVVYIIIYFDNTSLVHLIKCNLNGDLISNTTIDNVFDGVHFFDFPSNKIYYTWTEYSNPYYYVRVATTDLNGSNLISNRVVTNHNMVRYSIVKIGNELKYFYSNYTKYIYTGSSDLDCSNFSFIKSDLQCYSLGMSANDGSYGYSAFLTIIDNIYKYYLVKFTGSSFEYVEELYFQGEYEDLLIVDSNLYLVGNGEFVKYSLNLSYDSRTVIVDTGGNYGLTTEICILPEGNIYSWAQPDENDVLQLWTYPGDYIEPPTSGYPWSMYQSDMQNTGRTNNTVNISDNPALIWTRNSNEGQSFSNIVIDEDSTIYYGTSDGKLMAVNYDGSIKWECDLSWEVTEIDYIYNEEIDDWEEITTIRIVKPILSYGCPALATDGTIYVASGYYTDNGEYYGSGKLFAINPNGTLKWRHDIVSGHYSYPSALTIAIDGTIIFTSYYTYAINPDGTLKWKNSQNYTIVKPVISGDLVYLFGNPSVYAINKNTGQTIWTKSVGGGGFLYPAYNNQPFIFGNNLGYIYNSVLYACDLLTGETEWTYSISGNIYAIGSDNTLYIYYNSNIHAITPNGDLKWTYDIGGSVSSASKSGNIIIDSNENIFFTAYITSQLRKLFCIDSNGNLVFESVLSQYNLAIGGDGYLYVLNDNTVGKIGNYISPTPLPQVQCRATQIITSANTGKIILAVPIL